jgi:hypothetical protein
MKGDFPESVPYGYCHCGCGEKTTILPRNNTKNGYIKGEPMRFLLRHRPYVCGNIGKDAPGWKGGRHIEKRKNRNTGYIRIHMPGRPRSNSRNYIYEHILVAEKALEKHLPVGAVVHHIDGNGLNNNNNNLVVCHDDNYHKMLHARQRRLGCEI